MSNYPTNLSENSGKLSKHCGITKKEAKKVLSLGFNISKYNTNNIIHSIIRGKPSANPVSQAPSEKISEASDIFRGFS